MNCPVTHLARSDDSNTANRPNSSGSVMRRSGTLPTIAATCSSVKAARTVSVSVVPGAMALTRIPAGPNSAASVSVR